LAAPPPRHHASEPYLKEDRHNDESTTLSRDPVLALRPPSTALARYQPRYEPTGRDPAPWVPQYDRRSDENTPDYEPSQYDQREREYYDREHRPSARRYAPRSESRREDGQIDEPLRDGLASLGERLFFETRLSRSGNTGCATCHRPERAFSDVGRTSQADDGKAGRRNAPSLINSAALPSLLWDGRLRTLEQQALEPWKRGEMGITVAEAERRLRGFPSTSISSTSTSVRHHRPPAWQRRWRPMSGR